MRLRPSILLDPGQIWILRDTQHENLTASISTFKPTHLAKLWYFTNLDFPEIRVPPISLPNSYHGRGPRSVREVAVIWPEQWHVTCSSNNLVLSHILTFELANCMKFASTSYPLNKLHQRNNWTKIHLTWWFGNVWKINIKKCLLSNTI